MKEARYTLDNTDLYILLIYNAFQSNIIENKFICCAYPHSLQNFIIENPSKQYRKEIPSPDFPLNEATGIFRCDPAAKPASSSQ